jgi:hypothetical protein
MDLGKWTDPLGSGSGQVLVTSIMHWTNARLEMIRHNQLSHVQVLQVHLHVGIKGGRAEKETLVLPIKLPPKTLDTR